MRRSGHSPARPIVMVLDGLGLGGAERRAILLARHLRDAWGERVLVAGVGPRGSASELCDSIGLEWRSVPAPWDMGARGARYLGLVRFAVALSRIQPEVLAAWTVRPNLGCGLAWRVCGARTCVWNQTNVGLDCVAGRLAKLAVSQTPRFAANSQGGADFLTGRFGVPTDRVHVINNWVEPLRAVRGRDHWRRDLTTDDRSIVVTMVANLTVRKDHRTLLGAWGSVVHSCRRGCLPILVLAGRDDGLGGELRGMADALGVSSTVRFLGAVTDVGGLLSATDIGVLCSPSEGLSNAVLEYMAAGLPVVGSDIPGVAEAVGPEQRQWLAPSGNAAALADRLAALIEDGALRTRAGGANRERVRQCFDLATQCDKYVGEMLR